MAMRYRICKTFEVESGHMLSKHAERCRFPHGHSRRIEIVLSSESLDENDMVCDFKAIKLAVKDYLDTFDHAMAVNSRDPILPALKEASERVVVFENVDPTTEVMARAIFDYVAQHIRAGEVVINTESDSAQQSVFKFPDGLTLERVRVWETSTSWAEYGA